MSEVHLACSSLPFTNAAVMNSGNPQNHLKSTPGDALTLAARTERMWCRKLLDGLKALIVKIKKPERLWIDKLRKKSVSQAQKPAVNELRQAATAAPTQKKRLSQAQSAGFKTTLDAVSYLSTSPLVQQHSWEITLRTKQINELREAILDHSVSFIQIKQAVQTRGDLQLVHKLALPPTINKALNSLGTDRPNMSAVLGGLMQFARDSEAGWANSCENGAALGVEILKPEDRLDAVKQQQFLIKHLQAHMEDLGQRSEQKILRQLESEFGIRMRGIIDAAAANLSCRVDNTHSEEAQLLSRLNRISTLVVGLIDWLHTQLNVPLSEAVPDAPMIDLDLLNPQERAALMGIGLMPNQPAI